jgi:hypothetical protein
MLWFFFDTSALRLTRYMASVSKIAETVGKSKLILVSADRKLRESVEQEGFRTLDPEQASLDAVEELLHE